MIKLILVVFLSVALTNALFDGYPASAFTAHGRGFTPRTYYGGYAPVHHHAYQPARIQYQNPEPACLARCDLYNTIPKLQQDCFNVCVNLELELCKLCTFLPTLDRNTCTATLQCPA